MELDFSWMKPRETERIDRIMSKLRYLWVKSPDMRLIQFIHAYTKAFSETCDGFYYEDADLEASLDEKIESKGYTEEYKLYSNPLT